MENLSLSAALGKSTAPSNVVAESVVKRELDEYVKRLRLLRASELKLQLRVNGIFREAVKLGIVQKMPCSICGDQNSHGHHTDYSKPLLVVWLCPEHHRQAHALPNPFTIGGLPPLSKRSTSKRNCQNCSAKFQPANLTQAYCSLQCKDRASQKRLRERAKVAMAMRGDQRMKERPYG